MPHDQPRIEVESADGHRFELIKVASGRPRRCLLLLPGMGITARHYIDFAQVMAEHGDSVLIHEWRGIGSSNLRARRGFDWGYRELLEFDLSASLRAAIGAAPGGYVWLAGHSLGSQLACLLAARESLNVAGLMLIAGGSPYYPTFPWPARAAVFALIHCAPVIARAFGYFPGRALRFAGHEATGVMRDWSRTARTGHYDLDSLDFDAEHALARLTVPVIALRLARDWFVPEASMQWLTAKLKRCQLEHVEPEGGAAVLDEDHFSWMRNPQSVALCLLNQLGRSRVQG